MRRIVAALFFTLALAAAAAAQDSVVDKTKDTTKDAASAVADKAGDAKDATVSGAKKTGNWFKRTWHKIF